MFSPITVVTISIDTLERVEDDTLAFMLQTYLEAIHHHQDAGLTKLFEQVNEIQPLSMDEFEQLSNYVKSWIYASGVVERLWRSPYRINITCAVKTKRHTWMTIRLMEGKLPNVTDRLQLT